MILHIFRTKVMNRGLNSKRLVKKIKKNGERPPSVPPRREEGLSKLRDCFAIACMEKSTIRHLRWRVCPSRQFDKFVTWAGW